MRGYRVYRDCADATERVPPIATTSLPTYRDINLAPATYAYEVSAVSRFYVAGNSTPSVVETPRSAAVTATVGAVSFAWNDAKAKLGEPVAVKLSIANSLNYDVAGKEQTVAFDPAYLTFVRVEKSGLTDDLALETSRHEGVVTVRVNCGKLAAGSGTFLTFVFETVKAGETTVGGANFVATDTNGTLTVSIFGSAATNVTSGSGSIANVTFDDD